MVTATPNNVQKLGLAALLPQEALDKQKTIAAVETPAGSSPQKDEPAAKKKGEEHMISV